MGSFCSSKKEKVTNMNTTDKQPVPSLNEYQPSKEPFQDNRPNLYTQKNNKNHQYIKPHINYSYGLSNGNEREQTPNNKNPFTKNDFMEMKKYYFNLITLMSSNKKTIGQGGQAKIRKYYSSKFKKIVVEKVIKVNINASASVKKQEYLDKIDLYRKVTLLLSYDYPNIIKIYDFIENPFTIVMEYCERGSLRSILDKKIYLPQLYKIFLILSICDGLGYIHNKGIFHGDLKCDNILLSDEKKYYIGNKYYPIPKLADFGLSQFSQNKIAVDTRGFVAPEIFEDSALNFKTDIFALGLIMFEILSGLRPLPLNLDLAMQLLDEGIPPCTKEVLKLAWEKKDEYFLPGIKNNYYDDFYTIMILCIDDDPKKRPDILKLYLTVRKLYLILLEETEEEVYDESEALKHK